MNTTFCSPVLVLGCGSGGAMGGTTGGTLFGRSFKKLMFLPHRQQNAGDAISADPQNGQYICGGGEEEESY